MMLNHLPAELLHDITSRLLLKDLKSLSLASKQFHSVCAPTLWKTVCVDIPWAKGKRSLVDINRVAHCASALQNATPALRNATKLVFRRELRWASRYELDLVDTDAEPEDGADEEDEPLRRVACFHPQDQKEYYPVLDVVDLIDVNAKPQDRKNQLPIDNMNYLARLACSVIEAIPVGQLRSFRWDLATCVPGNVLDTLSTKQPQLSSLRIANDVECCTPSGQFSVPFQNLTHVSWHGPSDAVLGSLQETLELNQHHLTELEISLGNPILTRDDMDGEHSEDYDGNDYWEDPSLDARKPFSQLLPKGRPVFPFLTVLSLSRVSVGGKMRQAIDLSALKSLTIRRCPGWALFLKRNADRKSPISLEHFEIKSQEGDLFNDHIIARFLLSFKGLKDLFIGYHKSIGSCRLGPPSPTPPAISELWSAIAHHHATLRKMVVHRRGHEAGLACRKVIMDYVHDGYDLDIPQPFLDRWKLYPNSHPMSPLELECVGFPYDTRRRLDSLREVLEVFATKSTLKLLHLRQTGSDFRFRGSRAILCSMKGPNYKFSRGHYIAGTLDDLDTRLLPQFVELLDWIFGPTGITSLEVVAFGDFAHGRNGWSLHNLFICRSSSGKGYRVFDARDNVNRHEWIDTADKYRSFLECLPVAPLVDSWLWGDTAQVYGF